MTRRVASGPYGNGQCFSREERTAPADVPVGQSFNPCSDEHGQRRTLGLLGIEEVRGIGVSSFEDGACDQQGDRHNRDDCRRARQMAGAAVVASQAARLANDSGLRTAGISGLGSITLSLAMSPIRMTVMMLLLGMTGISRMGRDRCHAVLTERHRHCCVALQREPQRDQHRQDGSPAVHRLSICRDIWLFQSSEPESGAKVPYISNKGGDLSILSVA